MAIYNSIFQQIKQIIDANKKSYKPVLIFGPLQSGKKTMLRQILTQLKYNVMEPKIGSSLSIYQDTGMFGTNAFIVPMEEYGVGLLPHVHKSPAFHVCHNPYDYGTKDDIIKKFRMLEMKTGMAYNRGNMGYQLRDPKLNLWEATTTIQRSDISKNEPLQEALHACTTAGFYLSEVVHQSYTIAQGVTMDQASEAADSIAYADIMNKDPQIKLQDVVDIFSTIVPIRTCRISSRNLIIKKPVLPKRKFEDLYIDLNIDNKSDNKSEENTEKKKKRRVK
jgi:hypothetical protein